MSSQHADPQPQPHPQLQSGSRLDGSAANQEAEKRRNEPSSLRDFLAEIDTVALRLRGCKANAELGFPAGEAALLKLLGSHGQLTVPQLARLRGTSRQNIQVLVNRLEVEALISVITNPAHRRSVLIRLTAQGQERARLAADWGHHFEERLLPHFTEGELVSAAELLTRLHGLLSAERATSVRSPPSPEEGRLRSRTRRKPRIRKAGEVAANWEKPAAESESAASAQATNYELPVNLL